MPADAAGLVVGRGGTVVEQICQASGADIRVSGEDDTPPVLSDRIVTIWGDATQKEAACREIIRITHRTQDVADGEEGIFVVIVPTSSTEFIVGLDGATINHLNEASGAEVRISENTVEGTQLQPISIVGSLAQTTSAAAGISELLQQLADDGRLEGDLWQSRVPRGRLGTRRSDHAAKGRAGRVDATGATGSRSATPGRGSSGGQSASSRSPTPAGGTTTGGASSRAGSSSSRSAMSSRVRQSEIGAPVYFIVSAPLAAWVVGRGGRIISEIRSKSGASVEVARSGGSSRLIDIRGSLEARAAAIELLLETMDLFPEGAPQLLRMLVPNEAAGHLLGTGSRVIQELCEESGAEIDVADGTGVGGDGSYILILSGAREPVLQAAQLAAARVAEAGAVAATDAPSAPASAESRAPAAGVAAGLLRAGASAVRARSEPKAQAQSPPRAARARETGEKVAEKGVAGETVVTARAEDDAVLAVSADGPSVREQPATAGKAGTPAGLLYAASALRTPREALLLQALLAGPHPNSAQLQLALPLELVRGPLIRGGRLRAIAERSGSKLELGPEYAPPATQLLTISGSMLGNSMAILYVQELLLQHGGAPL